MEMYLYYKQYDFIFGNKYRSICGFSISGVSFFFGDSTHVSLNKSMLIRD
jgi:hypothetical protein